MADELPNSQSAREIRTPQPETVVLKDRYIIQGAAPLRDLDTPSAKAYMVKDREEEKRALFALIVNPDMPVRGDVLKALSDHQITGLLPLVDFGRAFWLPFDQWTMVIIYERPLGGRLTDHTFCDDERFNEYDIPRKIIHPLHHALQEVGALKISHRAIRPDNMFYMDRDREILVLGDCASAPPGYNQPAIFETVRRGIASPHGRGDGTLSTDYYALGVSLVFLALGHNPIANLKDDDMLCRKLEVGSYAAICGRARVPVSLLEPIRGLIADEYSERWHTEELEMWINGKRNTPMQRKAARRADVPLEFCGQEHYILRSLVIDLSRHVVEAAKVIKDGTLAEWVRRHLDKPETAELMAAAVQDANANASNMKGTNDYLVGKICAILDPLGPIRYKGLAVLPEGFSHFLAYEICKNGNAQIPAELIMSDLPATLINSGLTPAHRTSGLEKTFRSLRGFLQAKNPGFGIERCLYELSSAIPCQSPMISKYYITEVKDLLPQLDDAASRADTSSKPLDRHIIGFIASRFEQNIEPHLKALANENEETALIGMLSLLALVQWHFKIPSLFGLTSWIGGLLTPAINTFHSRSTRRQIEREIPKLIRQGSLPDLFDLVDNIEKRRIDADGFENARSQYLAAENEIQDIETGSDDHQEEKGRKAQKTAATSAVMISLMVISLLFLLDMS